MASNIPPIFLEHVTRGYKGQANLHTRPTHHFHNLFYKYVNIEELLCNLSK